MITTDCEGLQTKITSRLGNCGHLKTSSETVGRICCRIFSNQNSTDSCRWEGSWQHLQEYLHFKQKTKFTIWIWLLQNSARQGYDQKLDWFYPRNHKVFMDWLIPKQWSNTMIIKTNILKVKIRKKALIKSFCFSFSLF